MAHLAHPLDFHLDEPGVMEAAFNSSFLKSAPGEEGDGHHHLSAADVLGGFFEDSAGDEVVVEEAPTSSSSEGGSSGSAGRSSGRNSETTPASHLLGGGASTGAQSHAVAGPSWLQMAPQLGVGLPPTAGPGSAMPALYQQQQQHQSAYHFTPAQAMWRPAFPTVEGTRQQQQTSKESKVTVSHSTIEKQRRDRINSLIDELRELVPPSASTKGTDGGDAKRPKHVVLSDTITLLRHLKEKVQQDELEKQRLQMMQQQMPQQSLSMQPASTHTSGGMMSLMMGADGTTAGSGMMMMPTATFAAAGQPSVSMAGVAQHQQHQSFSMPSMHATDCSLAGSVSMGQSAQSLLQHSLSASLNAASVTAAVGAATLAGCPDLPQAPPNLPSAVGVLVEEAAPGSFLVKVNCKDRHGLLSDITQALCSLPLQISRAAITTSNGGAVYDVFEIIAEPTAGGHESVSALDVQFHVHQAVALYRSKSAAGHPGAAAAGTAEGIAIGKRQRM